jgi:hypothetical protein
MQELNDDEKMIVLDVEATHVECSACWSTATLSINIRYNMNVAIAIKNKKDNKKVMH